MKKVKVLSGVLAMLMVLSVLSGMSVSAVAEMAENTFFCDFEDFAGDTPTTAECNESGFAWVLGPQNGVVETDATNGKGIGVTNQFGLGINLDTPVTTGKVRIGFSFKGGSWGYLYLNNETSSSWDATSGKRKTMLNYGANGVTVMDSSGAGVSGGTKAITNGTWYYVECIVDADANSWTLYVDGKKVKEYVWTDGDTDTIPQIGGFTFYNGGARTSWGLIDNIAVSVEKDEMQVISTEATDEEITVAFSEKLADGITADDITITECGGTNTIDVADVDVQVNKMVITYDGTIEAGKEYMVTFSDSVAGLSGKAAEDAAYIYLPLDTTVVTYTELMDFEDTSVDVDDYANILCSNSYVLDPTKATGLSQTTVDASTVGNSKASGSALGVTCYTWARILDVIPTDVGVETYEFDFRTPGGNPGYNGEGSLRIYADSAATTYYVRTPISSTWKHMEIIYDTVNDTVTVKVDGEVSRVTENVTSFNDRPRFMLYSTSKVQFEMDNYTSYTTVTPLSLKSVRYVGADGNVTGANTITPETTRIDLTFSEDIDDTTVDAITLSAGDINDINVEGNIVSLEIPGMLPGGEDITLTIPDEVAALSGNTLLVDRVYNISTKAGKFEISNLALTANGSEITAAGATGAAGDSVVVTADVINTEGKDTSIAVIYAYYNDDQLVDVDYVDVPIGDTEYTKEISESFTTKASIEYDTVKAFIWDDLINATPQIEAPIYPAN